MARILFTEWYAKHGIKKRDAYRLIENGSLKPVKEKRKVMQEREIWVLCIDDDVKPE